MQSPDAQRNRGRIIVWWIIWGAILSGLVMIYSFLGRGQSVSPELAKEKMLTGLIGLIPLFISVVIRWLVLPRCTEMSRAFVWFIIGLSLAEGCGLLGIFLGGPYRDDLFLIGLFGIVQYVPIFAKNYIEPKGSGFIPNN
jgi:cadmium resistance protein CadD (predicted permease)